jgi:hypothetical protein
MALAALACSQGDFIDPPQPEVPLPSPLFLNVGEADTSYNEGTSVELSGSVGRFRLEGTVSVPGPTYTIDLSGKRQGLNVVVNIDAVALPGGQPSSDLSGRSLAVEWELVRGTYRVVVQDNLRLLLERVIEVQ